MMKITDFRIHYDLGLTQYNTVAVIIHSGEHFVIKGSDEKLSVLFSVLTIHHYLYIGTLPHEMCRRTREDP